MICYESYRIHIQLLITKDGFAMENYSFFALAARMKYINRWGLMRNTKSESLTEHCAETAIFAHALAVIGNKYFGKSYNPELVMAVAMFHDITEVYTGDMPTPAKYFNNDMRNSYKEIEHKAAEKILSKLPKELSCEYEKLILSSDHQIIKLVKAADKLSAYLKCKEELSCGNPEFSKALESTKTAIDNLDCAELKYFMEHFCDSFTKSLDEL